MNKLTKLACLVLSIALVEVPFAIHANAGMIPTGDAISALSRTENRAKVEQFMSRQEVRSQFAKFGVNPEEAGIRVASMSDSEIQKLATTIDQNPAGADTVVISLTAVLLVVVILLLLGKL